MDERAETAWKWALRGLGVFGFIVLVAFWRDAPVAFYVLLGGLLGLPNVISYQLALSRENQRLRELGFDPSDLGHGDGEEDG